MLTSWRSSDATHWPFRHRFPRSGLLRLLSVGGMVNGEERTVQLEGMADEPTSTDLDRLKELYFVRFPDGRDRQHWPGLTYIRVKPQWLPFSDFNQSPPAIVNSRSELTCTSGC